MSFLVSRSRSARRMRSRARRLITAWLCGSTLSKGQSVRLSPRPHAHEQVRGRPAVGGQAELDLHVADGDAALEPEHAVDAPDVIAALFQELLQIAGLVEADLW